MARPINKEKGIEFLKDIKNKYDQVIDVMSMEISEQLLRAYEISITSFYKRDYGGYVRNGHMYLGITEYGGGDYYMGTRFVDKDAWKDMRDNFIDFINLGKTATDLYKSYRFTTNIDTRNSILNNHPFKNFIKNKKNSIKIGYSLSGDWVFNRAYSEDIHGAKWDETINWAFKHGNFQWHPYWKEHDNIPENAPAVIMEKKYKNICKNLDKQSKKTFDKIFKGR